MREDNEQRSRKINCKRKKTAAIKKKREGREKNELDKEDAATRRWILQGCNT